MFKLALSQPGAAKAVRNTTEKQQLVYVFTIKPRCTSVFFKIYDRTQILPVKVKN